MVLSRLKLNTRRLQISAGGIQSTSNVPNWNHVSTKGNAANLRFSSVYTNYVILFVVEMTLMVIKVISDLLIF